MTKVNIDGKEYCVETLTIFENERLKKESDEDKDIKQTKNKKDLMLLNIVNTAISMCENKLDYTLEDTISYVKKSLKELEESEDE